MTSRRAFLKQLGLGALAVAAPAAARGAEKMPTRKPNVIMILTDDQGWGDVHSHGNERLDTPWMDRLADQGARFDRFYVNPLCAPTRAAVLTGRYHRRTGVSGVARRTETMRADEVTIAQALKAGGYATACFGKWHNGAYYPHHPRGKGFDECLGFCCGHWNNYFDTLLEHNGEPVRPKGYINDVLTDAALAFIEKHKGQPFFVYLPYNTPHSPFQVPDRYFSKYRQRGFDDRDACVYAMCESLDDNLGRLLERLDALGLANDTIVIFFGDNGPNGTRYNGGMRGAKGSVHEGGCRNAFFIRWPGHIAPGTEVKPIAAHIDLLPTLVELTGVPMIETKPLDGVSLVPLLTGHADGWPERMIFVVQGNRGAVRTQQYRLVVEGRKPQLYDMLADPGEKKDIATEQPEVTAKLKAAYDAWLKDANRDGTAVPPIPVGHEQMKLVEMPTPDADWHGHLQFGGRHPNNNWATHWTSTDDWLDWDIDVVHAGPYEFTLMYICPKEDAGSRVCVEVAGRRLEGVVDKPHEPNFLPSPDRVKRQEVYERDWAPLVLGRLDLPKGHTRLAVKALTKPGEAVMDLKAIRVCRLD